MKKVSIVIPVYNAEKFVVRCLDSIKRQTYQNFEIILINDRSSDNTLLTLENYKQNNPSLEMHIVTNDRNSGPSVSRNAGIDRATGDYIFFIDADDDLADDAALALFISKTEGQPDIVFGEHHFFVNDRLTESNYHTLKNTKESYSNDEILNGFFSVEWASVVWNKLYDLGFIKNNQLRFPEGLLHEDELWVFQISALARKINFVNQKTYNYYYSNQGSITANVGIKNLNDYKDILKEKLRFAKEYNLYTTNDRTEKYIRDFAKKILLAKVVLLDFKTFRTFYLALRKDFADCFPKSDEFSIQPFLAYYLYKMKFDDRYFLYGKLPKFVNPLLRI